MNLIEPTEAATTGTVLVVDDIVSNRTLLRDLLETSGFSVIEAEDGAAALTGLETLRPDVILLDVMMPNMDGIEVCRRLKANPSTAPIPVIMVTSLQDRDDRIRGIEAGATDFMSKPIDRIEVLLKTRNAVTSKRLHDSMREKCERLIELERLRDDLTQMIVHDLRSPLSGIMVSLNLLEMALDESDNEALEDLAHALDSVRAMSRMTDSLLDVTKMESGELIPCRERVDVADIVEDAMRALGGLVDDTTVKVEQPDAPVVLSIDGDLITRVVENLLGNALKFAPAGSVVTIRIRATPGGGRIEVSDTGLGIPVEYREKIFDKFGQVDLREHRVRKSTGLGLAFCKLAVEAHGGTLGVESELNTGSTFWVELTDPQAGARILVIDDDQCVRKSLAIFLRRMGHEVVEASHGKEGIQALEDATADLVITDINMPEMDGIEVINALREAGLDMPIIAISGGGICETELLLGNAKLLGAVSTFTKPFELEEVREAVEAALAGRRSSRE